jgi:hypothetical protein
LRAAFQSLTFEAILFWSDRISHALIIVISERFQIQPLRFLTSCAFRKRFGSIKSDNQNGKTTPFKVGLRPTFLTVFLMAFSLKASIRTVGLERFGYEHCKT